MNTTQIVTAKYTELYDISTDIEKNVFYKIHTPTGVSHMKKLAGFYKQFKEYKYLGASLAWVPITTLPLDPLGVGYEAGDVADPRDLINPIIHKGYKGEALKIDYLSESILRTENTDATDAGRTTNPRMNESGGVSHLGQWNEQYNDWAHSIYYTSLTDPEWAKSHPREGFWKELFPVVRTLASTKAIGQKGIPPGAATNEGAVPNLQKDVEAIPEGSVGSGAGTFHTNLTDPGLNPIPLAWNSQGNVQDQVNWMGVSQGDIFTHEFERLGWLETSGQGTAKTLRAGLGVTATDTNTWTDLDLNRMPKVYMYLVQTPPAYKQRQYYRMSITHLFGFRKFRQVYGIDGPNIWSDEQVERRKDTARLPVTIAGAKMYDYSGTLHDDDFVIPPYEPALENTIEVDPGAGATIVKISDGVS